MTISPLLPETFCLILLRGSYFLLCKRYILLLDLKSVISSTTHDSPPLSPIISPSSSSPSRRLSAGVGNSSIKLNNLEIGFRDDELLQEEEAGMKRSSMMNDESEGEIRLGGSSTSVGGRNKSSGGELFQSLATNLFCLSFSESCMLFTLVLFGEIVSEQTRWLNWSISLTTLLLLIIFIIPLGLCLLLTHRNKKSPATKTLYLTLIVYSIYLFVYYKVGAWIAGKFVVEGSGSIGIINSLLSRTCVPGVVLIALISGGGAVNTAWEAFEWRSISSAEPVTTTQVLTAERSLYRARLEISTRTRTIAVARSSIDTPPSSSASSSFFSRLTSTKPAHETNLISLELELKSLESMEEMLMNDLERLKKRKLMNELGRTFSGRIWLGLGWGLSIYCVWRVFISCINLIFGYSQTHHSPSPSPDQQGGTDLITSLLSKLVSTLSLNLDVQIWSRLIGLGLIGSIILANLRNVLLNFGKIFNGKEGQGNRGVGNGFMLLFLAELMSIYLLTSLISLPSTSKEISTSLLASLPSFKVFSRLFDSVFLIAATIVFLGRWLEKKIVRSDY